MVRELVAETPDVRVVLMSGFSAETIDKHGFARNKLTLIEKPFSRNVLMDAVSGTIASQRIRSSLRA